ncbi:uncharacterized protein LOC116176847 [Photinus pyralis]|uniref:uncharacterized protein LOC116176847 n=1 Tax=Photinus pyralis TaxID=7054 RepID=UPI0012677B97|nr:uncharacterized protein LOC116176847 [Photinus pyralis]
MKQPCATCTVLVAIVIMAVSQVHTEVSQKLMNFPADNEQVETMIEATQEHPWAIFTFGGKKRSVSFIPRLGRELGDENMEKWFRDGEMKTERSSPFVPRLGRESLIQKPYFVPRLGKREE